MVATARSDQTRRGRGLRGSDSARRASSDDGALRYLVDLLDAFMWRAEPDTLRFTFVTHSAEELLGHPVDAWLGGPEQWGELIDPQDRDRVVRELQGAAGAADDREIDFRVATADGRTVWLRHAVRTVGSKSKSELWGLTTDVTAAKEAEAASSARYRQMSVKAERFRRQALHDALTDLPNRILFDDRLAQSLRQAERDGEPCAVMIVDVDRFKEINDTQGHQAGDRVLKEIAVRLRIALRRPDTAARIGGDEFAAVMPGADAEGATRAAERFVRAMGSPCGPDESPLAVGASVGIAVYPDHGTEPAELLRRADEAMYRAKRERTGHAVAVEGVPPDVPRTWRWRRWTLTVAAAALGLSSWAYASMAHHRPDTVATRLDSAADSLAKAKTGPAVNAALSSAERTLDTMSWDQVRGPELLKSLTGLHRRLVSIRSQVTGAVRRRVQQLTLNVEQAEAVAQVKTQPPARPAVKPGVKN